jgi:hypothetical protein
LSLEYSTDAIAHVHVTFEVHWLIDGSAPETVADRSKLNGMFGSTTSGTPLTSVTVTGVGAAMPYWALVRKAVRMAATFSTFRTTGRSALGGTALMNSLIVCSISVPILSTQYQRSLVNVRLE